MQYKTTQRLFKGIYQYKIVLVVPGASYFRSGDMDATIKQLQKVDLSKSISDSFYQTNKIRTKEDLVYALALQKELKQLSNVDVRVETPWISVYANSRKDIDALANIDIDRVKYISLPPISASLNDKTIIMPKMKYDYRITLGKTTHNFNSFVEWAETNTKVKLTKSCIRDLNKDKSWGGTHLYVNGDNTLLMVKMHLGGAINKIERIVKA